MSSNIPGFLKDEINDALRDAFREPNQFKRMLRHKCELELNKITNSNSNYQDIVDDVLEYCESRSLLPNLLRGARVDNPDNSSLEKVVNKFNSIAALIYILDDLIEKDTKYLEDMKHIYRQCCPHDWSKNGGDPYPHNLNKILAELNRIPQDSTNENYLVYFVANLLNHKDIPREIVNKLSEWGKKNDNNFEKILKSGKHNQQELNLATSIPTLVSETIILSPNTEQTLMNLSGETIKKIREAIKFTFPKRSELVMMVRMELNIPESEVPDDSNYNIVVFKLIEQLERQGRILDLINGALNSEPGNEKLQELAKHINSR